MATTDAVVMPGVIMVSTLSARVALRSRRVALLELGLRSKWAGVSGVGGGDDSSPCVYLGATPDTSGINPFLRHDTVVSFPSFVGWYVWNVGASKDVLRVTLVKEVE